jgi:hypothetical protein
VPDVLRCSKTFRILIVFVAVGIARAAYPQFTPFSDRSSSVLEGNWQSCRERDGAYAERIYDNTLPGIGPFELHLGPYLDFALFRGIQDSHRDHGSPENLLVPHTVQLSGNKARQRWDVSGLRLEVALAGGSRSDCMSWFVLLKKTGGSSQ